MICDLGFDADNADFFMICDLGFDADNADFFMICDLDFGFWVLTQITLIFYDLGFGFYLSFVV